MKYQFLNNKEILTPLLDIDMSGENVDLHNDFECYKTNRNGSNIEFLFQRINEDEKAENNLALIFSNVVETNYDEVRNDDRIGELTTIVNFSKGGLTKENKYYGSDCIFYFFIGFEDGELVNFFCKEVVVITW